MPSKLHKLQPNWGEQLLNRIPQISATIIPMQNVFRLLRSLRANFLFRCSLVSPIFFPPLSIPWHRKIPQSRPASSCRERLVWLLVRDVTIKRYELWKCLLTLNSRAEGEESRLSSGICSECSHWQRLRCRFFVLRIQVLFVSVWLANTEAFAYQSSASLISVEFIWLAFSNWILNWFSNICHPRLAQPRRYQFAVCLRFKWIPEASKIIISNPP